MAGTRNLIIGCDGTWNDTDERRKFFQVLRWRKNDRVNQTWFAGVHSDVDGGYSECGLSDIALHWMIDRAYEHGMKFKASSVKALKKDVRGKLHDSYQGIWKAFGTRQRFIADSAQIHVSVQERLAAVAEYQPKNLPDEPDYRG